MHASPIAPFLDRQGYLLLDGGLATELELRGHDLRHSLWSARLLGENPEAILQVHRAFLEAGADCIISSSYQATPQGLVENGCSPKEARTLLELSWSLARDACEEAAETREGPAPLAAASIGSYGAYLADGSEYRGHYGVSVRDLVEFHRPRFEVLGALAPLIAFETIPCLEEAEAIRQLLGSRPEVSAWVSFSCRDGERLASGHTIEEAASVFDDLPSVVAVGANCTSPLHVSPLITRLRSRRVQKEIVVYPNSGATYCAESKTWDEGAAMTGVSELAPDWVAEGARLVGGCCRVSAAELGGIAQALRPRR